MADVGQFDELKRDSFVEMGFAVDDFDLSYSCFVVFVLAADNWLPAVGKSSFEVGVVERLADEVVAFGTD